AGRVQRFPELAFARASFADRDVRDLVVVVERRAIGNLWHAAVNQPRLGASNRVQTMWADGAALRRDVDTAMSPVRRHLATNVGRIVLGADRREEHLVRSEAERQAQRAIAIVGKEPVVSRAQMLTGRHQDRFVPRAADLKKSFALVLELDLLVIDRS